MASSKSNGTPKSAPKALAPKMGPTAKMKTAPGNKTMGKGSPMMKKGGRMC